ncbi:hypothetical protein LS72_003395 [Helicobacter apodemus]|uniref:Histidine kinase n=1 Tax=Helicobacter apodemus TaxID=135569 RepID=A0A4U8UFM2_9HELI|nr:hypothetical protein [Helicobacter apodemus]TLE16316.1 hypothetical protein LS72_003395 [Helicobacter apodemus]
MAYYWKNKIKEHFIKRRYLEVLKDCSYLYAKIIAELDSEMVKQQSKLNEMKTIEMFSMLADMALEHEEEARALFEYYQVTKTKNNWQAEESIIEMIGNFDKNLCELSMVIQSIQDIDIDKNDGILYKDFKELEKDIGFKEAFEDLMFSSKIIFTNKNDFLYFVKNLVKFGYEDIAMNYFENSGSFLFFDRDFLNFYKEILQNRKH